LNGAAAQIFLSESAPLGRAEKRLWNMMSTPLDTASAPDAAQTLATLGQAKTNLDASLAADQGKGDAAPVIDATTKALTDFAAFQNAASLAAPYYAAAKRKQFATLYGALQTETGQIAALANVSKPWLLASHARKAAYQTRQDNAAQAKAAMTQLDALSPTLAKINDLKQLDAAIAQATAAKTTLDGLLAASNAAAL
jgi:hypothetical protein